MELIISSLISVAGAIVPLVSNRKQKTQPGTREDGLLLTEEQDPTPGYIILGMVILIIILIMVVALKNRKK